MIPFFIAGLWCQDSQFKEQSISQSRKSAIVAFDVYKRIISRSYSEGVKVLAFQYPNERGEVLEIGLGSTPAKILATREAILEAIVQLILEELFDRDFEHLKAKGSCIVGQYMARHILTEFGEKIVERKMRDCRRI